VPPKNDTPAGGASYRTERADPGADRTAIRDVWRTGLTQKGMPEAKLDWYYLRNPGGPPIVCFLRHEGSAAAVGTASLSLRRMRLDGSDVAAGVLADFVVVPDHRSFFPALFLQKDMRRRGRESFPVVFGLPNEQSEAVVRRAGYRRVGLEVRRARVLRSGVYLSRHLPPWLGKALGALIDRARMAAVAALAQRMPFTAQWLDAPDERFDDLCLRATSPGVLTGVRDRRFLAWRFADCPFHAYRFYAVACSRTGRLAAYAACRARGDTLEICDFLVDRGVARAGARLWLGVAREAYREGYRSVSVEFLGGDAVRREMELAGFVAREGRPMYAAFDGPASLADEAGWYLTLADEDT
jgi:hypothetical protein